MMSSASLIEAEKWIRKLNLKPHPEGGSFREVYRSGITVQYASLGSGAPSERSSGTCIYYLLAGEDYSAWHRLKSDEMWHFYAGVPVRLYQIGPDGKFSVTRLGVNWDSDSVPQGLIPAGNWFAAELAVKEGFALMGCTVTPGFTFEDFEIAGPGQLASLCPAQSDLISRLTHGGVDQRLSKREGSSQT